MWTLWHVISVHFSSSEEPVVPRYFHFPASFLWISNVLYYSVHWEAKRSNISMSASIRCCTDCDLSARQPGLWFGAQKLKCEQMNRKGNGSTKGMWNQISLTLWFLLSRTLAYQQYSSWQSTLSKQSVFLFVFFSFPSIVFFPLLFSFFFSLAFSLPLSLQMG